MADNAHGPVIPDDPMFFGLSAFAHRIWYRMGGISATMNLWILLILSVVEIGLVFVLKVAGEGNITLVAIVLIGIAIPKFFLIPSVFMHMGHDPVIFSKFALFPVFFIIVMFLGISVFAPSDVSALPGWCRPPAGLEDLTGRLLGYE